MSFIAAHWPSSPMVMALGTMGILALALGLLILAARPALNEWKMVRRAHRHIALRPNVRAKAAQRQSSAAPILRAADIAGWAAMLEAQFSSNGRLRTRLDATGLVIPSRRFLLIDLAIGAAILLLALNLGLSVGGAFLLAVSLGLGGPWWFLGHLAQRRRSAFANRFPEAIGLIVRGLKAGLPVSDTIVEVGREIVGPVGEEFRGVGDQLRLGQALEAALWLVAKRLALPALNFFVITLSVQRETGGNLAETLENLDEILRSREAMRLKVRAMSSEAIASAAIIGSLPLVMGVLMAFASPGYIDPLFTTALGKLLLGAATASMIAGIIVMRQMVKFEI